MSRDYYYFGSRAVVFPQHLLAICHQTQGHRSDSNEDYFDDFVYWLRGLGLAAGQLYGWPDHVVDGLARAEDADATCGPQS